VLCFPAVLHQSGVRAKRQRLIFVISFLDELAYNLRYPRVFHYNLVLKIFWSKHFRKDSKNLKKKKNNKNNNKNNEKKKKKPKKTKVVEKFVKIKHVVDLCSMMTIRWIELNQH
jgi:hypothetical protein